MKAFAFWLCLFGATVALADTEVKTGKTLPLFSVVTFPNDVCGGGDRNGTCFTSEECETKGGKSEGDCAEGFGVCCVFELECGDSSSVNNTYLVQASSTSVTSPCSYTICKASNDICRIRFDFSNFVLAGTPVGTVVAVGATTATIVQGGALGHCVQDQFSISSGSGGTPVICGNNVGQHMIVDADDGCHMATFLVGSATSTSRVWDIWVTQYNCGEDDTNMGGPQGCLQYFTATTGYVRSFAFPAAGTTITADITHLANQKYTACIRRAAGSCFICYAPETSGTAGVINQGTFGVSIGPTAAIVQGSINTFCATDYIQIAGGAATPGTLATTVATKLCGRFFSSTATGAAHATVCTRQSPYRISVNFDEIEITTSAAASMTTTNEQNGTPGGIIGFALVYTQGTTGCP